MTIIQKLMVGIILLFLLSACTRDRPEPEVVTIPETQDNAAVGGGTGAVLPATENQPITQPSDGELTSNSPTAAPVNQPAIQQATPVVVVQPIQQPENQTTNETIQYTVQGGDTLFLIAEKYGVSADRIRDLNYLQGDNIQANQVLRIPLIEGYTAEGRPTETPEPLVHVVEAGETLYGIAVQYGLDPTSIIAANNIADQNGIFIGQGLRIPGYSASPSAGVIQEQPTQQVIVIDPGNSTGSPAVVTSGTPVPANSVQVIHVVQAGESLYGIAASYDVGADEIAAANDIQNYELLRVGQRLFIPGVAADAPSVLANQQIHIVQAGEGLLGIAVRYGVTSEAISAANNIADSDLIYPGQQLIIPGQ